MKRRHLLQGAAALALAAPLGLRAQDAGPGAFDTLDLDWTDGARQRPVPVRLYRPQAMAEGARVPLIVFSHGIGGSRRGYTWLGRFVAAHGIASLHLQHVGSDRTLWSGGLFSLVGRLQDAAQADEALARVLDFRFALDTLLAGEWGGGIDRQRIVAAGHSYGANTSLLVAGARVPQDAAAPALADPRVRAAIVMSAPPFYGEPEPRRILQGVTVPTLHVTCTDDVIRIPGFWSGFEDRLAVFEATGSARKWLAVFEGGSHSIFTDRGGTGGAVLNPRVKQATRELALAFVRGVFEGDERALAQWPQRHA
ncbi:MAG: alpha/beta hydrolase family protein, partial [Betaproteobacteria bacterium]